MDVYNAGWYKYNEEGVKAAPNQGMHMNRIKLKIMFQI